MAVLTLYLLALKENVAIPSFLTKLRNGKVEPVVQAKVLRWIVLPSEQSAAYLLGRNTRWDLLIGLGPDSDIPPSAATDIDAIWTVSSGVSSATLSTYREKNTKLIQTSAPPIPLPSNQARDSQQTLDLSPELHEWISTRPAAIQNHPVSMLNLLTFHPGKKNQYKRYGVEFSTRVGSRFGGRVKIAARVVEGGGQAKADGWDEIAFVHYPSLSHFAGMLADGEYRAVNRELRLGALKDTFILCVVEVNNDGQVVGREPKGRL